ncbi:aminotransferase class I/II-fold pyridoxal phosphate-dependent enzyme [Bacillus sp. FJAT-49705]|uniref:Aminotransferase class I/II-fold pyridoxal phosphate-dependent enzyme n=1 Tax=Cytobacillus citreus TaxID=2833586 RepID=A0ABS5NWW3_9BACI|nr:aminotransferase class I/II-fold pyridoxal phosphate-dependent enzyme [Cytobacillus citreus]MBS4192324.1 aminotransferase class I/II-fold pyridoxal phosphate-dependent enzyme [Cytobacillus citreus]
MFFSSGYLANIGVISSVMKKGDIIFSDAWNHASIIDGCRLSQANTIVYEHADMVDLERKLRQSSGDGKKLILTDGVFSMDGDIAPLPEIVALAKKYNAYDFKIGVRKLQGLWKRSGIFNFIPLHK